VKNVKTFFELAVDKLRQNDINRWSTTEQDEILIQQIVDQFTRIGVSFVALNNKVKTVEKCGETCFEKILLKIDQMYRSLVDILNLSVDV